MSRCSQGKEANAAKFKFLFIWNIACSLRVHLPAGEHYWEWSDFSRRSEKEVM